MSEIRKSVTILIVSILIILGTLTYVASHYIGEFIFSTSQRLIQEPNSPQNAK
jgi:hypothetical protein